MTTTHSTSVLDFPMSAAQRFLPEGPYAIGEGRFSWVAIQHGSDSKTGSLNIFDMNSGENQSFDLPGRPGFAFPCKTPGKFVIGCERSVGIFDTANGAFDLICQHIDADVENTIINDGLVVDDNLIFGTKDLEFNNEKAGLYLYRGRDKHLVRLRDDQICSNGKAIRYHADGSMWLVDIDSPTRKIVTYPLNIDSGKLGEPRVLVDLTNDAAVPDGAILTPEGKGIIVSMFLPQAAPVGQTRLYDIESGKLLCVWETKGSPQNTCPAIVPHQGKLKLVISTAIEHMSQADLETCPNAGRLFVAELPLPYNNYMLPPVFPV